MTRGEYERQTAAGFGKTVSQMRALGYWSARTEEPDRGEWQHVAIPPGNTTEDKERRDEILAQFRPPWAKRDLDPRRFGGGGS